MKKISNNRTNVFTIIYDKNNPAQFSSTIETVDVIYLDIITNENLRTQILNHEKTLKNSGFLIIILNKIIKINEPSFRDQINNIIINYNSSLKLIQEINLANFFKKSIICFFWCDSRSII